MTEKVLTPEEAAAFVAFGVIEPATYDRLYEHFTTNGEMPYGVAKARTGDPDQWIADWIAQETTPHAE